jgi:hypothetical protein
MSLKHFRLAGVLARLASGLAAAVLLAGRAAPLQAQNLLKNPDFVSNLDSWQVIGQATWDGTLDAEGAPNEGSAKEVFDSSMVNGIEGELVQCVPLTIGITTWEGRSTYPPATRQPAAPTS